MFLFKDKEIQENYKGESLVNDFSENSKNACEYLISLNQTTKKEAPNKKKQPKLLTRTGSDPKFDNIEYLQKIE